MPARVCAHTWKGEQRRREREPRADSALSIEPGSRLNPTTARSGPEPKPGVGCLTS